MLAQLIQLLQDKKLIDTAEEVADILWLAQQVELTLASATRVSSALAGQTTGTPRDETPAGMPRDQVAQTERHRADVYATPATTADLTATRAARAVRLPAVPALPQALAISRALHPLMRRTRSRTRFLLDEPTTAQHIADTDDWTPVLYPEPTRWLDVALVIDESSSMSMWQRTALEFYRLLERQGAFRSVTLWGLATGLDGVGIHLHTGLGMALERTRSRDPRELLDHRGQRLILFVSDGIAAGWPKQTIPALLADWAKQGMVALVQVLPEALWPRTEIRNYPAVALRTQRVGALNQELKATWLFPRLGQPKPAGVALPVIPLEAGAITLWARLVAGDNRVPLRGIILPDNLQPLKLTPLTPAAAAPAASLPPSEELLRRFYNNASPTARRLAAYLATLSTFTVPLVHLIQHVLLPPVRQKNLPTLETRQLDLAEVLLSGLIRRVTPRDRFDIPADQVEYRFLNEEVRIQLIQTVHVGATNEVRELVAKLSDYLDGRSGQVRDFVAYVVDQIGDFQIAPTYQYMAQIHLDSLRRINNSIATASASNKEQIKGPLGQVDWARRQEILLSRLEAPSNVYLIDVQPHIDHLIGKLAVPDSPWLLAIEGLGGIGKTALADAVVRSVIRQGLFDEVGWVSARRNQLNLGGAITEVDQPALTATALVEELARQLLPEFAASGRVHPNEWLNSLRTRLKQTPHLIVVDNLETLVDLESLLPTLQELANPSKFLLTSRQSLYTVPNIYHFKMPELDLNGALRLIRQEAETSNLPLLAACSDAELRPIHTFVGGNPLALRLVVGQTHTYSLESILRDLQMVQTQANENLYTYVYRRAWDSLDAISQTVLLAMPLINSEQGDSLEIIATVSEMEAGAVRMALNRLVMFNLIDVRGGLNDRRYSIHGLTRIFLHNHVLRWQG